MKRILFEIALLVFCSTATLAAKQKISPDFRGVHPGSRVNVIIQYKVQPNNTQHQWVKNHGGSLRAELKAIRGAGYSVPMSSLSTLAADTDIAYISVDRKISGMLDNTAAAVNAPTAWLAGWKGSGIGIALIDSGLSKHADLLAGGSRVVYSQDFTSGSLLNLSSGSSVQFGGGTTDQYGHGEHVAGIIAGNGTDSSCSICFRNFIGIAPRANLINLRVLDSNGESADSTVIAAIYQAIQLQSTYNIRVINLSIGRPVYESYTQDPLCQAVEAAWKAGIVVVVAAGNYGRDNSVGNNGYGTITAPGNDPYVITVGAMKSMGTPQRADDLIASYSSKGPTAIDHIIKPDLVAPGNLVVSLLARNATLENTYPQNQVPLTYYQWTSSSALSGNYFILSGTSMAAPVVSGAAALLLQANPNLTPDQVKAKLMLTAYKSFPQSSTAYDPTTGQSFTDEYDIFTIGAGYLDIAAALSDNTPFTGTAMSPTAVFHPSYDPNGADVVCYSGSVCAQQTVWGNQSVWGTQSIWGNQSVWGTQSIWGNQSVWGTQSVWGNQSIWGTEDSWATWFTSTEFTELTDIAIHGDQQ